MHKMQHGEPVRKTQGDPWKFIQGFLNRSNANMDNTTGSLPPGAQYLHLLQEDPVVSDGNTGAMALAHAEYLAAFHEMTNPAVPSPELSLLSNIVMIDFQLGQILTSLQIDEIPESHLAGTKMAYAKYVSRRRELVNELHELRTNK